MKIVVCCKLTPDPGDIEVLRDGSISLQRAEWSIGNFDLQALEAGVQLVESSEGQVVVLSAGPVQINQSKLKKDLLSRGPDELVMVVDPALDDTNTATTAAVLAAAVRKIEGVDLVLCGEGSADLYFQQVGLQLGEILGQPTLNAICKIEAQDGKLLVERSLEEETEVLEVPLPAVLSVTTDIAQPRLPTMKMILTAGKKPVQEWSLADLNINDLNQDQVQVESVRAPDQVQRKNVLIPGSPEESAKALVEHLSREGVI